MSLVNRLSISTKIAILCVLAIGMIGMVNLFAMHSLLQAKPSGLGSSARKATCGSRGRSARTRPFHREADKLKAGNVVWMATPSWSTASPP